jgi:hypothetical protein
MEVFRVLGELSTEGYIKSGQARQGYLVKERLGYARNQTYHN